MYLAMAYGLGVCTSLMLLALLWLCELHRRAWLTITLTRVERGTVALLCWA